MSTVITVEFPTALEAVTEILYMVSDLKLDIVKLVSVPLMVVMLPTSSPTHL